MSRLGKSFGPGSDQEFINESIQVYRKGRLVWVVDERDRVYVTVDKKKVGLGYNHSRAWRSMMAPYSPYSNDCDVEFWTQADIEQMNKIIARRKPLNVDPLPIED